MKILAGDVGGTKTILQISEYVNGEFNQIIEQRFESQNYRSFDTILSEFFQDSSVSETKIDAACIGVAGPVTDTAAGTISKITNLPWKLASDRLASEFSIPDFTLINDFQAVGYGIERLSEEDIAVLQEGRSEPKATKAIIGAGTGVGHAFLVWDEKLNDYKVMPSEAGHSSFSPVNECEKELLNYLSGIFEHVSLEHVVSGPGITNIYNFLCQAGSRKPVKDMSSFHKSEDSTPGIVKCAIEETDPVAVEALDIFIAAYGSAAGNFALTVAATGGVYIAGGIAPKIAAKLQKGAFVSAFNAKNKMKSLLETIPVSLITNEKVGLLGAANYALKAYLTSES
jgi:glucokinase